MNSWIEEIEVNNAYRLWILIIKNVDYKIRLVNNKNSIVLSNFSAVYSELQLLDSLW
jgi:hypothetical protein